MLTEKEKTGYRTMTRFQLERVNIQLREHAIPMNTVLDRNAHLAFITQELRKRQHLSEQD